MARTTGRRNYRPKDPEHRRRTDLLRRYGITPEQYDAMLAAQGGVCAVCGCSEDQWKKRFAVDHCHQTDIVRGLLCFSCNTLIGRLEKRRDLLPKLLRYLREEKI